MKEFVCFPTTDSFVPVSRLSTRDLFNFLENLKIRQDMFCLEFLVEFDKSNNEHYDIPIPDYLFGIVFKRVSFLEYFTESIWCQYWFFLTHLFHKDV
jgi:hypothetical protein